MLSVHLLIVMSDMFSWISSHDHEMVVKILCFVCVELRGGSYLIFPTKWCPIVYQGIIITNHPLEY